MGKWVLTAKRADFKQISETFGISPALTRLIVNRDVREIDDIHKYLHGNLKDLYHPASMKDMPKAVRILKECIENGEKIAIASDFDVDGVFSGYILYKGFDRLGGNPVIYTPNRVSEGYGLNLRIVDEVCESGASILITCDNGIAAFEAVDYAKEKGLKVIVTDHHEVPYEEDTSGELEHADACAGHQFSTGIGDNNRRMLYVNADAIVNPKQPDCVYPFKKLCGAGVVYKLICMLYDSFGIPEEEKEDFIEYTAIATVADVMDLEDENRIIVKDGLKRLAVSKNIGIRALIRANNLAPERISAYHIGFVLGPCFNAAGRLDTVKIALDLLRSTDEDQAMLLATELKELNESRKNLTIQGFEQAIEQVESTTLKEDKILLLRLVGCHESLAGIIAGRLKEKYHKPVMVFTLVEGGLLKGSGRSIEAYNMFEELNRQRELFERFGGHPMAAGMTIKAENFELIKQRLNEQTTLTEADFVPIVRIDLAMPVSYLSESFVQELELLEPFGKGNPKPVFAEKYVSILKAAVLGKNKNVLKLKVMNDERAVVDAMYFGDIVAFDAYISKEYGADQLAAIYQGQPNDITIALTYYPDINEYMGVRTVQIVIQSYLRIAR